MATDEVQRYADVYTLQQFATNQAGQLFADEIKFPAPFIAEGDPPPSREELQQMMQGTAVAYTEFNALGQIVAQLEQQYALTLKQ